MSVDRPDGPYAEEMTEGAAWPAADEDTYTRRGEELGKTRTALTDALDAWQQHRAAIFNGPYIWTGTAADAAAAEVDRRAQAMQAAQQQLDTAIKRANETAGTIIGVKHQIAANVQETQQLIAQVEGNAQATSEQKAYFIDGLVKETHAKNVEAVAAAAAAMGPPPAAPRIAPADFRGRDVPLAPPEDTGPQIPRAGTDFNDVNRWWNSLSQEQKDRVIAQHSSELGNLRGVPTDVRDRVNQAVMNDDINRVEGIAGQNHVPVDQLTQHPESYGLTPAAITRYNNAIQTRDGLSKDSAGGKNPVFLQTYDPEAFGGRGREAIAIGNPDKADNTTVLVPGTGSSVRDGYLSHRDGLDLYNEARHADPGKVPSVVVWMGYHAPDSPLDPQIGQTTLARDGGGLLASDVNALGATHEGASHVTVVGHSYGSTTVADAAAGSGMHANDVVLVGCPGTDLAHSAADFHLSEGGHVYVGAVSSDPISHFGVVQEHIPGTGVTVGLGDDPAVEGYGSTRFKAEVPGLTNPLSDHSSYFTPGSESLFSIADIASGHGDGLAHDRMTAPHRGTYWLPDEIDPESIRPGTGGHYH